MFPVAAVPCPTIHIPLREMAFAKLWFPPPGTSPRPTKVAEATAPTVVAPMTMVVTIVFIVVLLARFMGYEAMI